MNNRLKLSNSMPKFYPDKPFIVVIANFSNILGKISNHTVLGYATRRPTMLMEVASTLVSQFSKSLGHIPPGEADAVDKSASMLGIPNGRYPSSTARTTMFAMDFPKHLKMFRCVLHNVSGEL